MSLSGKKLWKFRFYCCFSKAKTEECEQKIRSFSAKFGMLLPGSDTYFLEVSVDDSLKVAIKGYFRGKKLWKFRFYVTFRCFRFRVKEYVNLSVGKLWTTPNKKCYFYVWNESRTLTFQKNLWHLLHWNPFKNDKKGFLFHLSSALFVLKIFEFLSWLYGHVEKATWLER